jgi:hypothetical protein
MPTKFKSEKLEGKVQSENFRVDGVNIKIVLKDKLGTD